MIVGAEHQRTIGLYDVGTTEKYFSHYLPFFVHFTFDGSSLIEYINDTLIPTVHALSWYDPFFVDDPGQMVDYNNKFLGIVRIRQQRMPNNSCPRPDLAIRVDETCVAEFHDGSYVYKQKFQEGWESQLFYENDHERVKDFWIFGTSGMAVTGELLLMPFLYLTRLTVYYKPDREVHDSS